jgi:hypothetical protein
MDPVFCSSGTPELDSNGVPEGPIKQIGHQSQQIRKSIVLMQ